MRESLSPCFALAPLLPQDTERLEGAHITYSPKSQVNGHRALTLQ